jgi:CheY-like chemotaxis protein
MSSSLPETPRNLESAAPPAGDRDPVAAAAGEPGASSGRALASGSESAASAPATDVSRRVLLIEDNPDAAESMRLLLELVGHCVETASDGKTGLLRAQSFRPDVVLCDIGLPGEIDGYGVARLMRNDPELRDVHRVALTGFSQAEDRDRTRDAGFHAHLIKPVSLTDLQRVLTAVARRE